MSKDGTKSGSVTVGWTLDRDDRVRLLQTFPPHWPDIIADHVTLHPGKPSDPLPAPAKAEIVGHVDDGRGVEALVVRLDGTTDRPDGSTYHITWSLDRARGRRARESNDVIKALGWTALREPIPIRITPSVV